jgi:hypothetical protein
MPIDPSIPLGGQQQTQMNPLAIIGQWAQIQNAMNQNRLFQQTFLARQKAGQILAGAPNLEAGLQGLLSDPDVAPFAGETINNMRQAQLTMSQLQNLQQGQIKSGLDAFIKMLPAVLASPDDNTWGEIANSVLIQLPEELRSRTAFVFESLKKSILGGLSSDPEQAKQQAMQKLSGLAIAGGLSPEGFKQLYGGTETLDLGDRLQPVKKIPEQLGGGYRSFDQTFPKGLAPQITTQGGVPLQVGGGAPAIGANPLTGPQITPPGAQGNPLTPGISPSAQIERGKLAPPGERPHWMEHPELVGPEGRARIESDNAARAKQAPRSRAIPPAYASDLGLPGSQRPPAGAPQAPTDGEVAPESFTGKPLFDSIRVTPRPRSNITGAPLLNPQEQTASEEQTKNFYGEDQQRFDSQQQFLGQLNRMDHDLETLNKQGGFLAPGVAATQRLEIAKGMNFMAQLFGAKENELPFNTKAIATAEDFRKETVRAGFSLLTQQMGAQREAASVVSNAIQAVPNLDSTVLGSKLISDSLRAQSHRVIDRRYFQQEWARRNSGDLTGSAEAFNKAFPEKEYFETVLKSMGMSEKGFEDPTAIQRAYKAGYLSDEEAVNFLMEQFPQFRQRR